MTRKEYIDFCKKCELKAFDRDKGITCSITNEIANFETNCNDFKANSDYIEVVEDPNKNKLIILSIVAIFIVGLVIIFNIVKSDKTIKTEESTVTFYDLYDDEDCLEFASKVEYSLLEKDPLFLNRSLDYNYLVDYITFQRKMSKLSKQNFKAILKQSLKPGTLLLSQLEPGGHFSFRKYYKKNNKPHLVFRLFNNQSILILDFELGLLRKKIVIKNAYNYASGEFWGESFYNRFNLTIKYKSRPNALKQAYETTMQTQQLIAEEKFIEAQNMFNEIPTEFKNNSHAKSLEIHIAAHTSQEKYIKLIDSYIQRKKEEERFVALNSLIKNSTIGDTKNTIKNAEVLNKYLDGDNILDYYIASAYNIENDYSNAKKYINQFKEVYPTIYDGFILNLDIELKQNNIKNAIEILEDILIKFNINKEEIDQIITTSYPTLKQNSEYKNFIENF